MRRAPTAPGRRRSNPLRVWFKQHEGRVVNKWVHYLDVYHRHFAPFRGRPVTLLEFGVNRGGSLQMWRDYLGPQARIIGVDVDPECAAFAAEGIEVVIGDQEDRQFLRDLVARIGPLDIVVDDGGHTMRQQIATFEEVWPAVVDGGVLVVEDLHTSYWNGYGGGLRREGTFVEYVKGLVDQLHAWHSRQPEPEVDDYTRTIRGMHVYDSIVVLDKGTVDRPRARRSGHRGR
ncbi:class I SAM-dependent methyltransferase [Nocardioides nanhaiensis]|uniref:Class I SAM-dependent methyltransferase n=1 Tax=Nocardioides nanhaiensis TaxID=1476871 RepID=A0ABP8WA92_9ACTN